MFVGIFYGTMDVHVTEHCGPPTSDELCLFFTGKAIVQHEVSLSILNRIITITSHSMDWFQGKFAKPHIENGKIDGFR